MVCSVRDTGTGIDPEQASQLFQRFQQGAPRTHIEYGGSGLVSVQVRFRKVALTCHLAGPLHLQTNVQASRWRHYSHVQAWRRIHVHVLHPRRSMQRARRRVVNLGQFSTPLKGLEPAKMDGPLHVLLAEDNRINQLLLQKQLVKAGCVVAVANDGLEALNYVLKGKAGANPKYPLDLILMGETRSCLLNSSSWLTSIFCADVEMPIMNGKQCAEEIREKERAGELDRHIPIIAVSANARDEQVASYMACGMDDAVSKPFSVPDLLDKMQKLVHEHRTRLARDDGAAEEKSHAKRRIKRHEQTKRIVKTVISRKSSPRP